MAPGKKIIKTAAMCRFILAPNMPSDVNDSSIARPGGWLMTRIGPGTEDWMKLVIALRATVVIKSVSSSAREMQDN